MNSKANQALSESFYADRHIAGIGQLQLVPMVLEQHLDLIYEWVNQPHASFWGLMGASRDMVRKEYENLQAQPGHRVYIGVYNGTPMFLLEVYEAEFSPLVNKVILQPRDYGIHLLVAQANQPIHHFTFGVMVFCMDFVFNQFKAGRIVVEPDSNNEKIHRLNRVVGFRHQGKVKLGDKLAYWATCTQQQFKLAVNAYIDLNLDSKGTSQFSPFDSDLWNTVNLKLVKKMIAEWSHERILEPKKINSLQSLDRYRLVNQDASVVYEFNAQVLSLNHWSIDELTMERKSDNKAIRFDAVEFVCEFNSELKIPKDKLVTYLEEVTSTLYSAAYKRCSSRLPINELIIADLENIEAAMTEGHPCFVANNGRIGFNAEDFNRYAPEAAFPMHLEWLAITREKAVFSCVPDLNYEALITQELDPSLIDTFKDKLRECGKTWSDYYCIPVHPWQWKNKISTLFSRELSCKDIIYLGRGSDLYQAQQSIRTLLNLSRSKQRYVKVALSILNMGFVRGLSAEYMAVTPAINTWVAELIEHDNEINRLNFSILKEEAAIGYFNDYYSPEKVGNTAYNKMLSALWRESPKVGMKSEQRLMTMASLLHIEDDGDSFLKALINYSGLTAEQWLTQYLNCYFTPLLHCLYAHQLVFMPHGENLILKVERGVPVAAYMKDIGEEVCLLNSDLALPKGLERLHVKVSDDIAILSIFTDVFDGFFRFMAAILVERNLMSEYDFWQLVAENVKNYQHRFPQYSERFKAWDLFAPTFLHSCLNRLQLRNNFKMVDLSDPAGALQFSGTLNNPMAAFAEPQVNAMSDGKISNDEQRGKER
ncbi:GNAT family N-acetyltransferase [Pleionea litopenaei]|uniref:GNAT family N-acetyltransferase n=1 Tax=Pleionea litopenaei TaxID=3070815 RepID=A0AA51RSN7_9GAMM|nr:GNAT family N-acetyltransferase [Pleionea sp. HL-JVS1]WMS86749.1 GNAT family N-acetyltransferase [Pleionea sp. HL-JVS1]